jgi:serine phosphatase RsbU (regulator of sigma subunit)
MPPQKQSVDEASLRKRLQNLIKASQSLATIESFDALIPHLLSLARTVTEAEASSLLLYDADRGLLKLLSAKDEILGNQATDILKPMIELKLGEGIAGWVAQQRQPIIVADPARDSRFFSNIDRKTGFVTRNLMAVPVIYGDNLLGVIEAINSKTNPQFDHDDLEILESFAHLAAVAIVRSQLLEARIAQHKLEIQLEAAAKIQSLFWPASPEIGIDSHLWGISMPASFAGGDLYDWIALPDDSWLVYLADVSDKGLPAALIMAALWSRIRSEAFRHEGLEALLAAANRALYDLLASEGFFATILIAKYHPGSGGLSIINGGHPPAIYSVKKTPGLLCQPKNPCLGVFAGASFTAEHFHLSQGETVLFYSDGVTDALNPQGEYFGQQRMLDCLAHETPPWGPKLLDAVNSWRAGAQMSDDLTIVEIWRDKPAQA